MQSKITSFAVLILFLITVPGYAQEGTERGGGDPYALEFTNVARKAIRFLYSNPSCVPSGVSLTKLQHSLNSTLVLSDKHASLMTASGWTAENSPDMGAVNFPGSCVYRGKVMTGKPCIIVNRTRWDEVKNNTSRIVKLALHEYLGIARAGDQQYKISEKMESCLQKFSTHYSSEMSPTKKEVVISYSTGIDDFRFTCLIYTDGTATGMDLTWGVSVLPLSINTETFSKIKSLIQVLPPLPSHRKEVIPTYSSLWDTDEALDQAVVAPGLLFPEYAKKHQLNVPWFVKLPQNGPLYNLIEKTCNLAENFMAD